MNYIAEIRQKPYFNRNKSFERDYYPCGEDTDLIEIMSYITYLFLFNIFFTLDYEEI
jgi:hypothetical protein